MTRAQDSQIVLSASRRTDIPAFYMDWFMDQIHCGKFEVTNPYNGRVSTVPASPDRVHTIVFWSKNFGLFIESGHGDALLKKGYRLFFNFTVNSEASELEPCVPALPDRLTQLERLCQLFGPDAVNWRFDPVCFYSIGDTIPVNNLGDFVQIADRAASIGINRCVTSFLDDYPKIQKRLQMRNNGERCFKFVDPSPEKKLTVLLEMEDILSKKGIDLLVCCEKEIRRRLPEDSNIKDSACISNSLLTHIYGGNLSLRRDTGQRIRDGCGCQVSVDIGSYRKHPCYHNCLFCYANPKERSPGGPLPNSTPAGNSGKCRSHSNSG